MSGAARGPGTHEAGASGPGSEAAGACACASAASPPTRLTRAHALELFERERARRGYADATLRLERRLLQAALPRLARRALGRVTTRDLEHYLAERAGEVSANSLAREAAALKAFFAVLHALDALPRDPARDLVVRVGSPRAPLHLSPMSVGLLLAAASVEQPSRRSPAVRRALALRDRALLELLYGLGLRASEAGRARLADLDLSAGHLLVRRAKRGRPQVLPLAADTTRALARYLELGRPRLVHEVRDPDQHLLLTERGSPLRPNFVYSCVRKIGRRAGVEAHPHALRRALATHCVQRGVPLPAVREVLGHQRLDTTQAYVLVARADLRWAVDHLDFEPRES